MSRHRPLDDQDRPGRPGPGPARDVPEAPRHRRETAPPPARTDRILIPFPRRTMPRPTEGTTTPMALPRTVIPVGPRPVAPSDPPTRYVPAPAPRPAPEQPEPAETNRRLVALASPPAAPEPAPSAPAKETPDPAPVAAPAPEAPRSGGRLLGIDATRGVALLGMMAVHSLADVTDEGTPTWSFAVAAGRAAAIFAVLAGVGIAFLTGRRRVQAGERARPVAVSLLARGLVTGTIGLALGYTTTEFASVILPYYAVLFVLAIPLVFLGTRTLAALTVAMAIGLPVLDALLRVRVAAPDIDNASFADVVRDPIGLLVELTITGEYPALIWVTYLCAGLAVGRLTLSSARVAGGLLAGGTALALVSWFGSSLLLGRAGGLAAIQAAVPASGISAEDTADLLAFGADGTTPTSTWWWLAVARAHTGTPFDLAHTIGCALAVLGAMLLLTHVTAPAVRRAVAAVQVPLAAVGGMTLTLYTAHIVFINSPLDTLSPAGGYLLQIVVFLLFALGWRATAGRGPLEGLVSAVAGWARRRAEPAGDQGRLSER